LPVQLIWTPRSFFPSTVWYWSTNLYVSYLFSFPACSEWHLTLFISISIWLTTLAHG
jgi:hypothetical protein